MELIILIAMQCRSHVFKAKIWFLSICSYPYPVESIISFFRLIVRSEFKRYFSVSFSFPRILTSFSYLAFLFSSRLRCDFYYKIHDY